MEGIEALADWLDSGEEEKFQRVRELEREADEIKLDLMNKLDETFVTPFDREDIYDLCLLMDEIINQAKATVREVEILEVSANNAFLRELAQLLVEGTHCIKLSFINLKTNGKEASNQAFLARKCENRFTKVYRQALRQLYSLDDLKTILKTREVYRCMSHAANAMDVVGEKLLHVIVKIT